MDPQKIYNLTLQFITNYISIWLCISLIDGMPWGFFKEWEKLKEMLLTTFRLCLRYGQ